MNDRDETANDFITSSSTGSPNNRAPGELHVMPMKTEQHSTKLNRFTTLLTLLDLLRRRKLVLRDPSTWEDKNDAKIILEYKRRKKIPKLFAVFFCMGDETIHHWKAYADGVFGCCIEFDKSKLLTCFRGLHEVRYGKVIYKKIDEVENNTILIDCIPFIKRWPYRFEEEFRILWEGKTRGKATDLDIDLNSINKITLSQRMPKELYTSMERLLRANINDLSIEINMSTLFENRRWIKAFKKRGITSGSTGCAINPAPR